MSFIQVERNVSTMVIPLICYSSLDLLECSRGQRTKNHGTKSHHVHDIVQLHVTENSWNVYKFVRSIFGIALKCAKNILKVQTNWEVQQRQKLTLLDKSVCHKKNLTYHKNVWRKKFTHTTTQLQFFLPDVYTFDVMMPIRHSRKKMLSEHKLIWLLDKTSQEVSLVSSTWILDELTWTYNLNCAKQMKKLMIIIKGIFFLKIRVVVIVNLIILIYHYWVQNII